MNYVFNCPVCNKDWDIDIPMNKYDEQKNKQFCPWCKSKITRRIEWTGTATGSGQGWFGRSDGSKTI